MEQGAEARGGRVSMRMIAEKAGVSLATVSYALQGSTKVSTATRRSIERLAQELGYVSNPLIRQGMVQIRSTSERRVRSNLAYLSIEPIGELLHHRRLLGACRKQAQVLGYHIEAFQFGEQASENQRLAQILIARGVRGLLLAPSDDVVGAFEFPWAEFASLELGYSMGSFRHHRVSLDYWQILTESLTHLAQAGYRRIAFVGQKHGIRRTNYRYEAAYLLHRKERSFGSILLPHWVYEHMDPCKFESWLERARPDVIVSQDNHLFEFLKSFNGSGRGRVDFCSLLIQEPNSALSGMLVSLDSTAETAVDFLARRVESGDWGLPAAPVCLSVASRWQTGATLSRVISPGA
ncbi:LacI family DNA-binding transcriptional regulator [Coraliomargarita algicola]|uniref:LacI family DNA-binding transcriptional regulator n=1 Tax=Coraliomargarita algicola TaxID=3092156 RepID=A0ABZ0RIT6_9BACT|nr:LacI family DNA-binding transcriptional regulator [Coraliomargarita sp. J2-16]WPJ94852.1 LacI family DNA-binding transcriptional regulator [Coraliomargarita sp. J2-16]